MMAGNVLDFTWNKIKDTKKIINKEGGFEKKF